jgi:hypothetical protein
MPSYDTLYKILKMDTPDIAVYFMVLGITLIVILAISYYLWRWIFSIKRQLWNQRQQINILLKIAEKLGVDSKDSEILTIRYRNNDKDDSSLE